MRDRICFHPSTVFYPVIYDVFLHLMVTHLSQNERLKHYLRLEPNSSVGYFHLAVVYLEQREYNQSERMFLRTLELEPTYRAALYNLGFLMYHQARYGEVVLHLTKLMDLYPSHLNGAQTLADAYVQLSDPTKAEIWYKHVLRLDPNAVAALHNLGKSTSPSVEQMDVLEM